MKKFLLGLILFLLFALPTFALDKTALYVIKNATASQFTNELSTKLDQSTQIDKLNNIIYSIPNKYYIKAYTVDNNAELFLYSDKNEYEKLITAIKNSSYKTFLINDKLTLKKYNSDFMTFAKNNKLSFVKIKKSKINNLGYREYNPYSGKLKNKVLEITKISDSNIVIVRKKLKPKVKVKKKANEYEYIITNNTGNDIVINKVASDGFIGLTQIAVYVVIPQPIDFVPIWGLVYGIQTDIEKNKFSRPHPVDETIKAGESMRILALSKKSDNPVADFYFTINNKQVKIIYDSTKGEKF